MQLFAYRRTEAGIAARKARAVPVPTPILPAIPEPEEPVLTERAGDHHRLRRIEFRAIKLFKIKRVDLYSVRRQRDVAFARQFVMYWALRLTPLSMPQIGRLMGGRDHTTVLHGASIYPRKRALQGRTLKIVANSFKSRRVSLAYMPGRSAQKAEE